MGLCSVERASTSPPLREDHRWTATLVDPVGGAEKVFGAGLPGVRVVQMRGARRMNASADGTPASASCSGNRGTEEPELTLEWRPAVGCEQTPSRQGTCSSCWPMWRLNSGGTSPAPGWPAPFVHSAVGGSRRRDSPPPPTLSRRLSNTVR
jgi:hypothetical protein